MNEGAVSANPIFYCVISDPLPLSTKESQSWAHIFFSFCLLIFSSSQLSMSILLFIFSVSVLSMFILIFMFSTILSIFLLLSSSSFQLSMFILYFILSFLNLPCPSSISFSHPLNFPRPSSYSFPHLRSLWVFLH